MIRKVLCQLRKNENGHEVLEFAIVIPILLLLVFGIIEFGWIFHGYITLTGAAREGVRQAVVMENFNKAEVENTIKDHARIFEETNLDIRFEPAENVAYDEERKIIINGELDLLIGFPPFPSSINIPASATMRQER